MPAHSDPSAVPRRKLPDELLTPEELAVFFKVPVETVHQWRKKRTGPPGFRVGKYTRYDPADVHDWMTERKRTDISQAA
ncbi:helix-turn-helix domain-containing protein [Streptomyces sp. NPDC006879]|uniref:helix-turn-helix domain-containing protein n=1 Tax=Streptomyces sp. NPDC006879 TaxID=3364767 RepID=UPI0036802E46